MNPSTNIQEINDKFDHIDIFKEQYVKKVPVIHIINWEIILKLSSQKYSNYKELKGKWSKNLNKKL